MFLCTMAKWCTLGHCGELLLHQHGAAKSPIRSTWGSPEPPALATRSQQITTYIECVHAELDAAGMHTRFGRNRAIRFSGARRNGASERDPQR